MMNKLILGMYNLFSIPISIFFILSSRAIDKSYRMSLCRKMRLGFRMFLNTRRVTTGSSYRVHLAMALKLLETPPDVPGDIIECGTWKGGSAVNLSLVAKIVGRKLMIFDSFEGLPEGEPGDRLAAGHQKGTYLGTLEEVKSNISRHGAIGSCEFIKGWYKDTLPALKTKVLLAFLDVDLESSLHTCVKYIWPNLVDRGYLFVDEAVGVHYTSLFYSERWWLKYCNTTPPGLIGSGTGLPLGNYYIGPWQPWGDMSNYPFQSASSCAYTQKGIIGYWAYFPDEP